MKDIFQSVNTEKNASVDKIYCAWEHNGADTLLYAVDFIGAYTRGSSLTEALAKMPNEIASYLIWSGTKQPVPTEIEVIEEKNSDLLIADADSDILFSKETKVLTHQEYLWLKTLALKSANDVLTLYHSIPDKKAAAALPRKTFYGAVPRNADEMYLHIRHVTPYYFGEIGVPADCEGNIYDCRRRGFQVLESQKAFLRNNVVTGNGGELWSLRKVLRRFLWHDRIHAKAMYRMAIKLFDHAQISNPFYF
ncbi:MAG: hypothetical protein IJC98_09005 [Clostridia bacterium]|nr:hypothetical protein [Clostridia bacterium]